MASKEKMQRDIIFITIDCWRYDALARMENLLSITKEYKRTEAICQSAATNGVFAPILSSMYYPHAYNGYDKVRSCVNTLPKILSENGGFTTGAVVASNPFLNKWAEYFNFFWNDGLSNSSDDVSYFDSLLLRKIKNIYDFATLHKRVPVTKVSKIAKKWYLNEEKPRFLLMHIMEPHDPYYPGLKRGFQGGLIETYKSIYKYYKNPLKLEKKYINLRQNLYWRCIDKLDSEIHEIIDFIDDDATVFIMADHGEEFYHGINKHARLYDECVRVPLLVKWTLPKSLNISKDGIRQIDIPYTILKNLDISPPKNWEGMSINNGQKYSFLINHAPQLKETYIGIRTNKFKMIRTLDTKTNEVLRMELYNLADDNEEKQNIYNKDRHLGELETLLNEFQSWVLFKPEIKNHLKKLKTQGLI